MEYFFWNNWYNPKKVKNIFPFVIDCETHIDLICNDESHPQSCALLYGILSSTWSHVDESFHMWLFILRFSNGSTKGHGHYWTLFFFLKLYYFFSPFEMSFIYNFIVVIESINSIATYISDIIEIILIFEIICYSKTNWLYHHYHVKM